MLIKAKTITLTSKVGGETTTKTFNIGRYPATEGVYMIGRVSELLKDGLRPDAKNTGSFAKRLREVSIEVCAYVEAKLPNGEFIALSSNEMINAHVSDGEMMLQLMKEVHDWNTFFFNSGRLLKTSRSMMDNIKQQTTKILSQLLGSSSQKNKRNSTS